MLPARSELRQYSKTCLKWPLSIRPKIGFKDQLSLNAGQKYSAILLTFIKLPFAIKIFVLSIFEWPLKTGFTVDYLTKHTCIETLIHRILKSNSLDPDEMLLLTMPHLSALQLFCTYWNNLSLNLLVIQYFIVRGYSVKLANFVFLTSVNQPDQTLLKAALHRESYMSAHVLLNLLHEFGKSDKM